MKKWFPDMIEAPEDRAVTSGVPYWVFAFFLLPLLINLSTITSRGQDYEIWFEIGYHVINFVFVLIVFLPSLRDAFLMVQANTKSFLRTVFACAGVIVVIKMVAYFSLSVSFGPPTIAIAVNSRSPSLTALKSAVLSAQFVGE